MTKQEPQTPYQRPRWKTWEVRGNEIILINEFGKEWVFITGKNRVDALNRSIELEWLIKCIQQDTEFNRLCRAGD